MTQSMSDPYAVLGIPRDASQRTALEAYRRLAKSAPRAGHRGCALTAVDHYRLPGGP
jgi:hypothetical protein